MVGIGDVTRLPGDRSGDAAAAAAGGKRPYHPAMLSALLFHGYATGVFPSRRLERATYGMLPFQYIAGGLHPDHDTIAAFRKRFLDEPGICFSRSCR